MHDGGHGDRDDPASRSTRQPRPSRAGSRASVTAATATSRLLSIGEVGEQAVEPQPVDRLGHLVEHPPALQDERELQHQRGDRDDGGHRVPGPGVRAPTLRTLGCGVPHENDLGQPVGDVVPGWSPRRRPAGGADRSLRHARAAQPPPTPRRCTTPSATPATEQLWTYRPTEPPADVAAMAALIERTLAADRHGDVRAGPDGRAGAGHRVVHADRPGHGQVEIAGVLYAKTLQRTRAATEAIHLSMRHAFDDLGYRRFEWKCDSLNEPSRRAAARLGFTYEGRFRHHMVIKGRNRDTDWFSVTDAEWPPCGPPTSLARPGQLRRRRAPAHQAPRHSRRLGRPQILRSQAGIATLAARSSTPVDCAHERSECCRFRWDLLARAGAAFPGQRGRRRDRGARVLRGVAVGRSRPGSAHDLR